MPTHNSQKTPSTQHPTLGLLQMFTFILSVFLFVEYMPLEMKSNYGALKSLETILYLIVYTQIHFFHFAFHLQRLLFSTFDFAS